MPNVIQNPNFVTSKKNSKSFSQLDGIPVYVADLHIDKSGVLLEIQKPNIEKLEFQFTNSAEDHKRMLNILQFENIKGIRLIGKKKDCELLVEMFLKKGIRPLMTDMAGDKRKRNTKSKIDDIPVINHQVAGIDIGKTLIMVAVPPHLSEDPVRAFGTFTEDLQAIVNWLKDLKISMVAMESTSVYWLPLFDLCQSSDIQCLIVNPKHVKMKPGRKTDVLDAQWLMRLLSCGLLNGGFIPPLEMRALRDLHRYRQDLMDRAADCLNQQHKMLSLMNIQLSNVIGDISGKSGSQIIQAIIDGQRDVKKLLTLVDKKCKTPLEEIEKALHGTYKEEHLFVLRREKLLYEAFHASVIETEKKIKELLDRLPDKPGLEPLKKASKSIRLKTDYNRSPYHFDMRILLYNKFGYDLTIFSGIECSTAATIIFETGGNMDAFPTSRNFRSWAGVSPGNKVSGGKRLSGKAPKKYSRVGQAFRIAANANYKSNSATGAFLRKQVRRGKTKKSARKATANRIADQVYNTMKFGQLYVEKGAEAYEKAYEERRLKSCIKTLEEFGYEINKKTIAA
jgi:transposase